MPNLLIINPNTTASVSALLQLHGQREAQAFAQVRAQVRVVTARFGAAYISCEASYAIAGHAALDAWGAALQSPTPAPDAVLIGCFGDPGLFALQEASSVPVTGLAQAALLEASERGRFVIVTGGARWKPMLQRLALSLGLNGSLAGIHTVAPTGAQLAQDPAGAQALLAQACEQAAMEYKADAVVLGGAGLAGMAQLIQAKVSVPIIDSVAAGVRHALGLASQHVNTGSTGRLEEIKPWLVR